MVGDRQDGRVVGRVMASSGIRRDDRLDFMRGIALLIIFIDHVPKNLFEPFTLHAFAFCDAAEIFFFISGFVAALVYGRVMEKKGFVAAARKVWRRAGVVYGAQFGLLAAVLAMVPVFWWLTGDSNIRYVFRVQWVYENPLAYVLPALTLHYQPGYLDILPAYVLLLAAFPLALAGLQRNVWCVLAPSFLLWLAVQLFGLTLWTTNGERWFFNPFAWQFLFVIGAVFGHPSSRGRMRFLDAPWLFWGAVAFAVPAAVIQLSEALNNLVWWVPDLHPDTMLLDKTGLGALRLVSFFSLAVIARRLLPVPGTLSANPATLYIVRTGSLSLQVFSFGVLLSSLTVVSMMASGSNVFVQSLLTVLGVAAQIGYANWRIKRREEARVLAAPVSEPVPIAVRSESPRR
jgi:hypothetical protein